MRRPEKVCSQVLSLRHLRRTSLQPALSPNTSGHHRISTHRRPTSSRKAARREHHSLAFLAPESFPPFSNAARGRARLTFPERARTPWPPSALNGSLTAGNQRG